MLVDVSFYGVNVSICDVLQVHRNKFEVLRNFQNSFLSFFFFFFLVCFRTA